MAGFNFSVDPVDVPTIQTENRLIATAIPCPGTRERLEELKKYESRSMHGQLPIIWDRAQGHSIYDKAGNQFIDFTSTIFVTNTGHANVAVCEAIESCLEKPLLHTYAYANELRIDYLKKLIHMSPDFEKAFLMSAGTEATEAACKIMSLYGQTKNKRKLGILSLEGNWHGRTMGAQLLSSNASQKAWITSGGGNNIHAPFPYEWALKGRSGEAFWKDSLNLLEEKGIDPKKELCGFMLETFQGWGACFYPADYVQAVEKFCRENDILLCFDEMQAGFARTGQMYGYQHYSVKPDLICVGKGMGSGLPISGVLGSAEIMDLPEVGDMSSTHSANPIVCAAALATLEEIELRKLIDRSAEMGKRFHQELHKVKDRFSERISYVYGEGLLAAVHFRKGDKVETVFPSHLSQLCMQKGLLVVHTGRESIKMAPPLTVSESALVEGVQVFAEALEELDRTWQE